MKLSRFVVLLALVLIVALIVVSVTNNNDLAVRHDGDGSFSNGTFGDGTFTSVTSVVSGQEILSSIEEFTGRTDIVVRGVPVSRVTEKRQLPLRSGMSVNDPLNVPRFILFDTFQFEVAEYLKGAGSKTVSIFQTRPVGEGVTSIVENSSPSLREGQEYVLFLRSTVLSGGRAYWGDGYLISGPTQGRWVVDGSEVERELLASTQWNARMSLESLREKVKPRP